MAHFKYGDLSSMNMHCNVKIAGFDISQTTLQLDIYLGCQHSRCICRRPGISMDKLLDSMLTMISSDSTRLGRSASTVTSRVVSETAQSDRSWKTEDQQEFQVMTAGESLICLDSNRLPPQKECFIRYLDKFGNLLYISHYWFAKKFGCFLLQSQE